MTVSINNIHSGGAQNIGSTTGFGSGQAGTITTSADSQIAVLIFATARTDTTSGTTINKVNSITASGLTFVEVFDQLDEFNVGGSFPYTNWHLQMFVAPVFTPVTSLAWNAVNNTSFANQQSCIGFAVAGTGNYTNGFDGDVAAAAATSYAASNTNTTLEQPSVNLTTTDANTLLLSIFLDSVLEADSTPAAFTANTGYTAIANVQSTRQYADGNLFVQYKTVTSTQAAVAQEPNASTRKFWQAVTLAFTESGTAPASTARITTEAAEVLHTVEGNARVTAVGAEVLQNANGNARVSALGVEVLRSVAVAVTGPKPPIVCVIT